MKTPNMAAIRITPQTYDILAAVMPDKVSRMKPKIIYYLVINIPELYFPTTSEGVEYGAPVLALTNRLCSYTYFHERFSFVGLEIDNQFVRVKEKPPVKEKEAKRTITPSSNYPYLGHIKMPWDYI